jgi:dipeptidyl aminopeptidase/acylaminoacyl peptidase
MFGAFVPVTDADKVREIGRQVLPVMYVSANDPPKLIYHGATDLLVPIQQAEVFVAKPRAVGVPARLVVKPGAGHGWAGRDRDMKLVADWFDEHLKPER